MSKKKKTKNKNTIRNKKRSRSRNRDKTERHTRVICGFSGIGKTYYKEHYEGLKIFDMNTTDFIDAGSHEEMDRQYMKAVKRVYISKAYDIMLLSDSISVKSFFAKSKIAYEYIYPAKEDKNIYLQRFKANNKPDDFIKTYDALWEECMTKDYGWGVPFQNQYMEFYYEPFIQYNMLEEGSFLSEYLKKVTSFLVNKNKK
jgi:hypothetical protein